MASQSVTALRTYAGEQGDERIARRREQLMDAALEVLGSDDGGALTVRGVCREAKLTARYFYESFDSADDLVAIGRDTESRVLARAIKSHLERRVFLCGHRTVVFAK